MPTLQETLENSRFVKEKLPEIHRIIADEANNDANLAELESISRTSNEGLFIYIPAYISAFFEEYVFKLFRSQIQSVIDNNTNLNDRWWATEIKKFQDGDELLFSASNKRPYYAVIDPDKQIIKYAAVVSQGGFSQVKVSKTDKEPLGPDELSRAIAYMREVQPSGANCEMVSLPSDKIKTPVTVYYNALKSEEVIAPLVEAAINNYLDNLEYNGDFYKSKFQDAIQAVPDVVDVVLGDFEARPNAEPSFTVFSRIYNPVSGVIEIDPDFPLEDAITYIPSNG